MGGDNHGTHAAPRVKSVHTHSRLSPHLCCYYARARGLKTKVRASLPSGGGGRAYPSPRACSGVVLLPSLVGR